MMLKITYISGLKFLGVYLLNVHISLINLFYKLAFEFIYPAEIWNFQGFDNCNLWTIEGY
mgnify:CR=1 FL=1